MTGLLRKTFRISLITGIGVGLWKVVRSKTQFPWVGGNNGAAGPPSVSAPAPPPPPAAVPVTPAAPASPAPASGEGAGASRGAGSRSKPAAGTGPARKAPTGRAEDPPGERLWVTASDGVCPPSHPVKAKLSSKIFHLPGTPHYSRTRADRCYPDETTAQADGLRPPMH